MIFLALSGKPHAGKDTFANAILNRWPDETRTYSVSEMICEELGVVRSEVKDARILQACGSKRRREDPFYWIRKVVAAVERERPAIAIFTNLRLINEVTVVRAYGAVTVRLTRLNENGSLYIAGDRDMNDPLETELDNFQFDYFITAKSGQTSWIAAQAIALVKTLRNGE
jgi:hypothetical protein